MLAWLGFDNGQPPVFVLIAQEKEPPYLVTVDEPKPWVIEGGRALNREALATYARCTRRGEWPGYEPVVHQLDVPGWRSAAYEAAVDRHDLIGETA